MKAVGVIPARYGSTRFPAKMLADLGGRPLFARTVERARKARTLEEVVLATDDKRIAEAAEREGIPVRMTRGDHPSGTDRVAEAAEGMDAEVIVNIQGDEPFMDPGLIDRLVGCMREREDLEMATAATPLGRVEEVRDPAVVKVVCDDQGDALYFSRSVIPFPRDAEMGGLMAEKLYLRHVGLYAYRRGFLERLVGLRPHPLEQAEKLEQLRALAAGARIAVLRTSQPAPGVDTPEDLEAARAWLARHGEGE